MFLFLLIVMFSFENATFCLFHEIDHHDQESKSWEPAGDEWLSSKWSGFKSPRQLSRVRSTGVNVNVLRSVGEISFSFFLFFFDDGEACLSSCCCF